MREIKFDCRHFAGDRPCTPHKEAGVHCSQCRSYDPTDKKILVIKLDAIGDVLRTTCILPALKNKYPHARITWITRSESLPLFLCNDYVDWVIDLSEAFSVLSVEKFDLVINLDASGLSSHLATLARAPQKLGFVCHEDGYVYPANPQADYWFELGLFDDLKRQNRKTYQQIIFEICGLTFDLKYLPVLNLTEQEKHLADNFARDHNLKGNLLVGFNTGAGGRWKNKKWPADCFLQLAQLIMRHTPNCRILLYGGPEERHRNRYLTEKLPQLIDTGCDNTLRTFCSLVDLCDLLVTGDTLALHIAVALKKRIAVLFGPTSHTEIELYGKGTKMCSDLNCLCCYKWDCDSRPNCMDSITVQQVFDAVTNLLHLDTIQASVVGPTNPESELVVAR
jgi:heptosyltransferase-2